MSKEQEERFLKLVFDNVGNRSFCDHLRHAENPNTALYAMDIFAGCGIGVEYEKYWLPYATVGAAIVRQKLTHDGNLSLGEALRLSFDNDSGNAAAIARLKRIVGCEDCVELCKVLRSVLKLIESRNFGCFINYAALLKQINTFDFNKDFIKLQIVSSFYKKDKEVKDDVKQ